MRRPATSAATNAVLGGEARPSRYSNERMKDAHGKEKGMSWGSDQEVNNGLLTNFSLVMLSCAVRDLVAARQKQSKKGGKLDFFFRKYLFDLIMLLQESTTGSALSDMFACLSQAPANAKTTKVSLEFGELFSKLEIKKRLMRSESRAKLVKNVSKALAESEAALGKSGGKSDKFSIVRQAQVRDGRQLLDVLVLSI
jgi:hypothetical protein